MKLPQAVIFDMDGLMIDSERVTFESYVQVMKEENLPFDIDLYRKVLGKTKQGIFRIFYDHYGNDLPMAELYGRVHQYINQEYAAHGVPVKEGLEETLDFLNARNIPCIIATSSNRHRVEDILKMSHLEGRFVDMVCGDDITRSKPDPEIFLKACQKAGISPENALVLEDSEAGIEAAWNAGIPVICVLDLKVPDLHFARMTADIVPSLLDVRDKLEQAVR